jgi:uncharacterized protein YqcC (DUF446 family)
MIPNFYSTKSLTLLELDRCIRTLSPTEQLWLLERIARHLREKTSTADKFADATYMEEQLAAMASDSDIQAEITTIDEEFAVTEMDDL